MQSLIIGSPLNVSDITMSGEKVHVTFNNSEIRNMKLF